jgi:hypothetical protein
MPRKRRVTGLRTDLNQLKIKLAQPTVAVSLNVKEIEIVAKALEMPIIAGRASSIRSMVTKRRGPVAIISPYPTHCPNCGYEL